MRTVGGVVTALARKYTKRGEPYAQFRLEGLAGGVDVVAFPSVYEAVPGLIETDRIVLATGRIDLRGQIIPIAGAFKEKGQGKAGKTILRVSVHAGEAPPSDGPVSMPEPLISLPISSMMSRSAS